MKLLRLLFLFFVPMACIAANTTYQTVLTEMKNGNFKFAEEMIDFEGREFVGVAKFLEEAGDSKIQLFI